MAKNPFKPDTGAKSEFIDVKKSAGILDDFAVRKVAHSRELYGQTAEFTDTVTIQQNTAGFEALVIQRAAGNNLTIEVPSGAPQAAQIQANGTNTALRVVTNTSTSPFGTGDVLLGGSSTAPTWFDYSSNNLMIGDDVAPETKIHVISTTGETAIFDFTNTAANVDKGVQFRQGGTTQAYYGNYYGFTGFINPNDGGNIFFGVGTDALAVQSYLLLNDDDVILDGTTLQFGSAGTNPSTLFYCSALGFYGTAPATQWNQSGTIGLLTTGGSGNALKWDDDVVDGNLGGSQYSIQDVVGALIKVGILAP